MHHCCIASKFSWVTFPSGRSNPLMSVRMFLGESEADALGGAGLAGPLEAVRAGRGTHSSKHSS